MIIQKRGTVDSEGILSLCVRQTAVSSTEGVKAPDRVDNIIPVDGFQLAYSL